MSKKKRTLKPWVKAVLGMIVIVLIISIVNACQPKIVGYDIHVAESGDTLWSFAKMSNGYDYIDGQTIVDDIKEASGIDDTIYPGDVIKVPIYE